MEESPRIKSANALHKLHRIMRICPSTCTGVRYRRAGHSPAEAAKAAAAPGRRRAGKDMEEGDENRLTGLEGVSHPCGSAKC
jgi:hypothetical protein